MAKVEGVREVIKALQERGKRYFAESQGRASATTSYKVSVIVGFTQAYALFVHENIEMKWRGYPRDRQVRRDKEGVARTGYKPATGPHSAGLFWGPTGQAKFLEAPARELAKELGAIVRRALTSGKTMAQGLLLAGLRLQREAQKRVPVDTGALRASAFTRLE